MDKYRNAAIKKGGQLLEYKYKQKSKWQCKDGHIFYMTGYKVLRRGKWCKTCGDSNGERNIRSVLQELQLPFTQQYSIPMIPTRRYDFMFEYKNKRYLIEFDGSQHFKQVRKYQSSKNKFIKGQVIDRIKTYAAWNSGYSLIRIDYTQELNVKYHILNAITFNNQVYFSNMEMYNYISQVNITQAELKKYTKIF